MSEILSMRLGNVDFKKLTAKQVRIAYVLKLPLRLRIGEYKHYRLDVCGGCEVAFQNALPVLTKEDSERIWHEPDRKPEKYHTDAVIIQNMVKLNETALQQMRSVDPTAKPQYPDLAANIFPAYDSHAPFFATCVNEVLTRVLSAYFHAAHREMSLNELREWLTGYSNVDCEVTITCPEDHAVSDAELHQLLSLMSRQRVFWGAGVAYDYHDIGLDTVEHMETALKRQEQFIFYEFALEAYMRPLVGDHTAGFLMSVIALESAHAAFVHHIFQSHTGNTPKQADTAMNEYLIEHGMSKLLNVTPFLFMNEQERPTDEEIKACRNALSLRNAIMHGKITKGKPAARDIDHRKLFEAHRAVERVYFCFVKALEKRLDEQTSA